MTTESSSIQYSVAPELTRVQHELRRRTLQVTAVTQLTPHMRRLTLAGPELSGFTSLSPDDHIKVFLPGLDGQVDRRDYTPRRFDGQQGELVLDFVVHEGGPATTWALEAKPGDTLVIGGPRGSQCCPASLKRWLLVGDETALPAVGRRIEEAGADQEITAVLLVPSAADEQHFETAAELTSHWIHRPLAQAGSAAGPISVLATLALQPDTFVWVAGETRMVKAVRSYLMAERHVPKGWIKAAGYWKQGTADSSERL